VYLEFLDLRKAYDTLDRDCTIAILKGNDVGKNLINFLQIIGNMDKMTPKKSGFFGKPFNASRGV
jgi:hypothetical protein